MMPQYGFYEAHLNAYNRDFWVQVDANTKGAIKFSDGKYYKEYQPGKVPNGETGIKESLNGEKNNYQFSARAVIDNYLKNDMPIGWFLPNDGYGAGYGQTDSLEGNLKNLADFIEYANFKGIQVGLWTQQNLAPVDPNNPKPDDRDFAAEVNDGVVALKTDVAWVGNGYSFGLDGLQKATDMLNSIKGDLLRPFIITLDGWAGTQRYAGIWTGDEVGGNWEYIRFQIPTYIGEGLSGQPYVGSDMDGIFGGGDPIINARDYEWKTFSPIQLNMDGWGENPKNPYTFGGKTEDINRAYLKLKSMMMPYNYTMDHEAATEAKPMVRALLLDYPNIPATYTNLTKYEYLWGDNFLIAPIYQDTAMDKDGNDIRNGIYLPDPNQIWVDYFTGKEYRGGQVINGFDAPIWKLPVFVKKGAIVPKTAAHNTPRDWNKADREFEIFPANGNSNFTVYEDDGISKEYLKGKSATTDVTSSLSGDHLTVNVGQLTGNYKGMVKDRTTEFDIKTTKAPTTVTAKVGGSDVALKEAKTLDEFNKGTNMYYFDQDYLTDSYLKDLGTGIAQSFLRVKLAATDATTNRVVLNVDGIKQESDPAKPIEPSKDIAIPSNVVKDASKSDYSHLAIKWDPVTGATTYNVKADGVLYNGIKDPNFALSDLIANSDHTFQVQSVVGDKVSNWSEALTLTTDADPLVNAVKVQSESVISSNIPQGVNIWQAGTPLSNMFDLNLTDQTHSNWAYTDKNTPATPMTIQVNLGAVNSLDSFEYVPRTDGGYNGILNHIILNTSVDGMHWTTSAEDTWARASQQPHMISFKPGTKAQFVNIVIPAGAGYGGFVSGNEMLFFKTPGTNGYMRGDITNDGNIDQNDITSLQNYAGLTAGIDSDFGGYVEKADLNQNGVIDAFDINYVSVLQSPQITHFDTAKPAGSLSLTADKDTYNVGDTVTLTVSGHNLANVNALSMKIPYSSKEIDIQDIASTKATSGMLSFSRKRTHSNGQQDIYVIFANQGEQPRLSGDADLATIKFTAKAPLNKKDLQFAILDPEFVDQWSSEFTPTASAPISISVNGTEINPDVEAKQALQTKVDDAKKLVEKDYTADSWKTLNDALTKAEDVLTNTASKAADYTKVSDVLTKAQAALVKASTPSTDNPGSSNPSTDNPSNPGSSTDTNNNSDNNTDKPSTDKPDKDSNEETSMTGVVYIPEVEGHKGWKVALLDKDGKYTGKFIATDSNWKVFAKKTIGGTTYYRIGTQEQWVPAKFANVVNDANKPEEETPVSGVAYVPVIRHMKNYRVALLDTDGNYTGKFISTDSSWKVLAVKVINGEKMLRIGTQEQWVPMKFTDFNI